VTAETPYIHAQAKQIHPLQSRHGRLSQLKRPRAAKLC